MGHMSPNLKARRGRFGPGGLAPVVAISAPVSGASYASAGSPPVAAVTFTGTANDDVDGDISAAIVWTSDLDGALGTGASVSPSLTVGTHVVTATATATTGSPAGVGTDTVTVTVT